MPWGDRTGPWGTFRNCMPVDAAGQPTAYRPFYGRRFYGRGGFGRGFRWRFLATGVPGWQAQPAPVQPAQPAPVQTVQPAPVQPAQPTKEEKLAEIRFLEEEMEDIKRRITQLRKEVK